MTNIEKYKKPELLSLKDFTKIENVSNAEINQLIAYLISLLGTGKNINQSDVLVYTDYILISLKKYTIQEIKKAFIMYLNGDLGEVKVFRKLDAVLTGEIIQKYNKYVIFHPETKQYKRNLIKREFENSKIMTEEEKRKIVIDGLKATLFDLKNDEKSKVYPSTLSMLKKNKIYLQTKDSLVLYIDLDAFYEMKYTSVLFNELKMKARRNVKQYIEEQKRKGFVFLTKKEYKEVASALKNRTPHKRITEEGGVLVISHFLRRLMTEKTNDYTKFLDLI